MHDVKTRPLSEAQRVFKAVFRRLFDTAYAITHLGFVSTSEGQIDAERQVVDRFNTEAKKAGWDVRLEQLGPALPDLLYKWDGQFFVPAPSGATYVLERWRRLGLRSPFPAGRGPLLKLHHKSAMVKGKLIPAKQGPIISKVGDGIGWALEYRPVGGLRVFIGDVRTINLKRGEWLSDSFTALWLQGEAQPVHQRIFQREAGWQWDRKLRKRVFWQQLDNEAVLEANAAERAEGKRRDRLRQYIAAIDAGLEDNPGARAFNSRTGRHSKRPYRPHFWNIRDYAESALIQFKDGKYARVTRQHGGAVLIIAVTLYLSGLYVSLLAAMPSPEKQRQLEAWRRYYKIDCWFNHRFDRRASAYLQLNETTERNDPYRQFDQRPRAYLHPEQAPKPGWKWWGGKAIQLISPATRHAVLDADRSAHNEQFESYWGYAPHKDYRPVWSARTDGPIVGLSKRMRQQRSLNLDRAIIEKRDCLVENMEHDFGRDAEKAV